MKPSDTLSGILSDDTVSNKILMLGVAGCFLLSGFAALLYQMAWMRQFSTVFGTSETAVATVLSAYMGGLALGAALSGRLVKLIHKPLLFYGILEALIAISALLVPLLLSVAGMLYAGLLGGQASLPDASGLGQPLFYFLVAFAVLIVPTACMGATLPVLTRYLVKQDNQIGRRVGALYAINTLGAVGGVIAAGFFLLPTLGLQGTVWCGVTINILVFFMALFVAKKSSLTATTEIKNQDHNDSKSSPELDSTYWLILPVMTLSGVCTFVYEVLWTRLLAHILGGSVAAFAIMLASFLSGIALGSLVASRFASTRTKAANAFVLCQLGIALTSVLIYYALNQYLASNSHYQASVFTAFLVLMPATLFIGATFPLAVRIYALSAKVAARSSAQVYAWNTLGAILGAAIAGFFLVPMLRYEGAIQAAVLLNSLLALLVVTTLPSARRRIPLVASVLSVAAVALVYQPSAPENILRFSPISAAASGDIIYYDVGRSSTVLMYEQDGVFKLRNNGLPEADAVPRGTPSILANQRILGALPVMARPDAKTALIVGLGTGAAITGMPPTVQEIDVIELEPKVIDANLFIADRRKYQPLKDPRLSLYVNDARSALSLTSKKYDIVISQPSHPWSAGASHLYTREYMQRVSEHLNDSGVFLQWINSQFVDEALLKSLCATILDVYPNVRLYQWSPQVLFFLASDQPLDVERDMLATGRPFKDAPSFYRELGVATVEDAVAALMMDEQGVRQFAANSRLITDDFNMMAMQSARLMREGRELNIAELAALLRPWIPALNVESWVQQQLGNQLRFTRIAEKYLALSARSYVPELIETLQQADNPQALIISALRSRAAGKPEQADQLLSAALVARPNNNQTIYALVQPWLRRLADEQTPQQIRAIANSMTGSGRAVIEASRALAQRDLQAVADLDASLSAAEPADLWFSEAVKLRIDWRNAVTNSGLKEQLANQAWQILDLAMANKNDHEFLAMRIVSAAQAGRSNELLQSTRGYSNAVDIQLKAVEDGYLAPQAAELDLKTNQIRAISQLLNDSANLPENAAINSSALTDIQQQLTLLETRANQLQLNH